MNELIEEAKKIQDVVVELRRRIHRHPEPGFKEFKTSSLVEEDLTRSGIEKVRRVGGTGILAEIGEAPYIMLRADMDALEIHEETGADYQSEVPGMMHACGHDAHTSILLGAAKLVKAHEHDLKCGVRFLFQPCEETAPGGALTMIREGGLKDVVASAALHVYPQESVGTIAVKKGPVMANADDFDLRIVGSSGHAAAPHDAVDSLLAASEFVARVQKIVSRYTSPFDSVVVTIGKFEAGTRRNVIPGYALLEGTARSLNDEMRDKVRDAIERAAKSIEIEMGVEADLNYIDGYPVVWNDERMTDHVAETGRAILGENHVTWLDHPSMGGEDYAYYAREVPSCFYRLGSGGSDPKTQFPHHNSRFNIDEECLAVGVATLAGTALRFSPEVVS